MRKCYYRFACAVVLAGAMGTMSTSCSDDEKDYPYDIYFTGPQAPVVVAGAKATVAPGEGSSAFNVTFDAASNWQISAKDFSNQDQVADWVRFFANSGEEGSQLLGVYLTANTTGKDRAAVISISCNGKSEAFTLVQQSDFAVPNPNVASISPYKTITKVEYYAAGATTPNKTIDFVYDANGVLSTENITEVKGDDRIHYGYAITTDSRTTQATVGLNKITVTDAEKISNGETFAVINGQVAIGYNVLTIMEGAASHIINFGYNQGFANRIAGAGVDCDFAWTGGNLTSIKNAGATTTAVYGTEPNDCNLDLNWFVGLESASAGVTTGSNALGAMNLLGKRSANLISSAGGENFVYADGATNENNETVSGLTITTSSHRTIKVFFAN